MDRLPKEGEIVLAWWGERFAKGMRLPGDGRWLQCDTGSWLDRGAPDRWVSIAQAKASTAMAEALKSWDDYFAYLEDADEPNSSLAQYRNRIHGARIEATRAALRAAGIE